MSTALRFTTVAFLLGLACAPRAASCFAIFTVGPGCPYATIQAALTASYYSPGEDYIWISNDYGTHTYSAEHIYIADQDVDIEGGFIDCNDYDIGPNETTTISGAGNDGGPVFEIGGNAHVYLGNLVIRNGSGSNGGGVSFIGTGALTLGNTIVTQNHVTGRGGGVYVSATGQGALLNEARLTLVDNTQIFFNSAVDGGGIAIASGALGSGQEFASTLIAASGETWIAYNTATRYGGGIFIGNEARAYVASPGFGQLGVINNNSAAQGGGVAVFVNSHSSTSAPPSALSLFSVDGSRPGRIQNNAASQSGGGVFLGQEAVGTSAQHPTACFAANDFRIDENVAPDGAAIHAQHSTGTVNSYYYGLNQLHLGSTGCNLPSAGIPASHCVSSAGCNSIDNNFAEDAQGSPTGGAVIRFETDGDMTVDHVRLRANSGGNIIRTLGLGALEGKLHTNNLLLIDNATSGDLISFEGPAYTECCDLHSSTISHNTIGGGIVYSGVRLSLYNDILDQPGTLALGYAGPSDYLYAGWNLASDPASLPPNSIVPGTPVFADAANGDYHLTRYSAGVDAGSVSYGDSYYDLDGNSRTKDLTSVPNAQGLGQDIGAFEMPYVCAADEVFCNAFGG